MNNLNEYIKVYQAHSNIELFNLYTKATVAYLIAAVILSFVISIFIKRKYGKGTSIEFPSIIGMFLVAGLIVYVPFGSYQEIKFENKRVEAEEQIKSLLNKDYTEMQLSLPELNLVDCDDSKGCVELQSKNNNEVIAKVNYKDLQGIGEDETFTLRTVKLSKENEITLKANDLHEFIEPIYEIVPQQ